MLELRQLFYLRAVILLTLLLSVLYSPELRFAPWIALSVLGALTVSHALLFWMIRRQAVPVDWDLYSSLLDLGVIALVIYAVSGLQLNLYIAYFVVVIGALVMDSLLFGFLIAGVACLFYAVTLAGNTSEFFTPGNLLPFAILIVASFFITYVASLIRDKRRALEREARRRSLWDERMAASRNLLGELGERIQKPLERLDAVSRKLGERGGSDIAWELDAIRGVLKRMGSVLDVRNAKRESMEIAEPLERAILRLREPIEEGGFQIDCPAPPERDIVGSKEHLTELLYVLLKDIMDGLGNGAKIGIAFRIRQPSWWERGEGVGAWLTMEILGMGKPKPAPAAEGAAPEGRPGIETAEWILASHGGRLESSPSASRPEPRYRFLLPIAVSRKQAVV